MITAADALAYCLAQPGATRDDCDRAVADHMVGGVYCGGDVLMVAGAPPRCIPRAQLDAKRAAELAHPLPSPPSFFQKNAALLFAGACVVGLAVVAYYATRRPSRSNPPAVRLSRAKSSLGLPWYRVNARDLSNLAGEKRYVMLETVGFGKYVVVDSYNDAGDALASGAWAGTALVDRDTGDVIDKWK